MSADNWTNCPRCTAKELKRVKEIQLRAGESYGKVSPDEYLELLAEAKKEPQVKDTLREDYEIGIHGGTFEVSYGCKCEVCGFTFSFKDSKLL